MANEFQQGLHDVIFWMKLHDVEFYFSEGTPTDSGPAKAALVLDTTNAKFYKNTGTKSSATWDQIGGIGDGEVELPDAGSINDSNSNELIEAGVTASAVNHIKITNAATGSDPTVSATGDDASVGLILEGKGSAYNITLKQAGDAGTALFQKTSDNAVGSKITMQQVSSSPAMWDAAATIIVASTDAGTNYTEYAAMLGLVGVTTDTSETGYWEFQTTNGGSLTKVAQMTHDTSNGILTIGDGAATGIIQSSGNYDLTLRTGNGTTGSITITDGADGDISILPNGSGRVQFGSHSSIGAETLSGFITIKDSGGTERKVGVVS